MESNYLDNDTRGWIMSVVSGIACVIGTSIVCVDFLIQYIPGKKDFRIQESNAFLAASLSLSFGVMIFSSLYSMLPSSKRYLVQGGYSASAAAWILLGCFSGGFIGIQIISRIAHYYAPSFVQHCDPDFFHHSRSQVQGHGGIYDRSRPHSKASSHDNPYQPNNEAATEATPLLVPTVEENGKPISKNLTPLRIDTQQPSSRRASENENRRPSLTQMQNRVMSFVKDTKTNCDESGPCFGYSEPCGQECFRTPISSRPSPLVRSATGNLSTRSHPPTLAEEGEDGISGISTAINKGDSENGESSNADSDVEAQHHHHHVPENAFADLGLQTTIAIALHKLPEGFITFATNHANPELGVSVFLALFVHNITEGFAMAFPLYMASGSRGKAMFWSSLFGGLSQPMGAGIAAAWFALAGRDGHAPNIVVYGCMFGITAGIMTSVALQLFEKSLKETHNRNLCIAFAFVGMSLMGMSNALTS